MIPFVVRCVQAAGISMWASASAVAIPASKISSESALSVTARDICIAPISEAKTPTAAWPFFRRSEAVREMLADRLDHPLKIIR